MTNDRETREAAELPFILHPSTLIPSSSILAARPAKNAVDPYRPYAFLTEAERTAHGRIEQVATIFLTNRECPFRCLMCDLWRNTTDERVPRGAIPEQIDYALSRLPAARHVKLYNSGNFFDPQAILPEDFAAIAERVCGFRTVIVENHPRLCGESCLQFRDLVETELEVALGLETIHPATLASLNKQMTVDDVDRAVEFLLSHGIAVRAFVLLRPPGQSEQQGVEWACRSIEHARARGVRCVSVIPVRGGNGIMEQLAASGDYAPPRLLSLEQVLVAALRESTRDNFRVFVDLWDAQRFAACQRCVAARIARLHAMNLSQTIPPKVQCNCE